MEYDDKIERLRDRIDARVKRLLREIGDGFAREGWQPRGVWRMWDDEYRWTLQVYEPGAVPGEDEEDSIDVTFKIAEQAQYEGPEDATGVTFRLDLDWYGGAIIGGMCPGNYSDDCWIDVDDTHALQKRFELFLADHIPGECVVVAERSR